MNKMLINLGKFQNIESSFKLLKSNSSDIAALHNLSREVSSIANKTIDVTTVKPEGKDQSCFVMCIYPDETVLDALVEAIISQKQDSVIENIWNNSEKWVIEIDTRILGDDVDLTERELTALILHEIGHIIYSNTIPVRIARVMKFEYAKTVSSTKQMMKDNLFRKVLMFPLLNACSTNKNATSARVEMAADKFAVKSGYGKDLQSGMNKIFAYAGSDSTNDDDMEQLMGFSVDTLIGLEKRQNHLVRQNVNHMIKSTPSKIGKNILGKFQKGIGATKLDYATEKANDQYLSDKIDTIFSAYTEAFFLRPKRLKKIDPADIDYIRIEVDNIKTNDDKMMIISYIYNKLDTIDYYLALIDSKDNRYIIPHSKESLVRMRDTLYECRERAINRKLPTVDYGINIQYPSGYEG